MNLLHRYLFRDLFIATVAGVAMFGAVLLAGNVIKDLISLIGDGRLALGRSVQMVAMLLPFVLTYALPMGLLTAVLLTLGRVSAQNEITAMRAAGVGLTRIGAPVLLIALAGVVACLFVNYSYAPAAKSKYRQMLAEIGQRDPINIVVPGRFIREFAGVVVYVNSRDGDVLKDVWVWKLSRKRDLELFAHGEEGQVHWIEETNELQLNLRNGSLQENPLALGSQIVPGGAGVIPLKFELQELFKRKTFKRKVSWMTFTELVAERARLRDATDPADVKRLQEVKMSIHEMSALAFSVFSLALVGVPLGIQTRRTETSANLGLALALTMAYYFLLIVATWVKDKPELHPELLLWFPNIAFQALGGWLWWRMGKN